MDSNLGDPWRPLPFRGGSMKFYRSNFYRTWCDLYLGSA